MKTYRLETSSAMRLQWIAPLMFAVAFPTFVWLAGSTRNGPPLFFAIVPFGVGVGFLVWMLRMPTRIEVGDDGSMEWIAPLRRIRLNPPEVMSIAPDGGGQGCFVLTHSSGRFRFMNQFTGFHELLAELKRANPSVELRGC